MMSGMVGHIAEEHRRRIAAIVRSDPQAPRYHVISPHTHAVCFDPNGALYWKGRYHLFFICQDPARKTGEEFWQAGHCWGHASSADLVHWTYHPIALAPEPGDPEAAIYSGCALVNKDGVPTLVYHGYGAGTCVATAQDDDLISWRKSPQNPVIPEPQEGEPGWGIYQVFDPHVWLEGDTYYAILGGQVKPDDVRDTAYLFTSPDLVHWEYRHPFYTPNPAWTHAREDCACPDFFRLGERYLLLCISHAQGMRYYLGRYEDGVFYPEEHHRMNWPGGPCFAPESLCDDRGRRIVWAWVISQRQGGVVHGEVGVLTLPRVLSLHADGMVRIEPAAELAALRRNPRHWQDCRLAADESMTLTGADGDCLEIALTADVPEQAVFGVKVRLSPDAGEYTTISYDAAREELVIDTAHATRNDDGWRPEPMDFWRDIPAENLTQQRAPLSLTPGEPLCMRIFLDRSILEVFANGCQCMTQRIYPARADSTGVLLFARDGQVTLHRADVWQMEEVNAG